jgi:hypothetical protein
MLSSEDVDLLNELKEQHASSCAQINDFRDKYFDYNEVIRNSILFESYEFNEIFEVLEIKEQTSFTRMFLVNLTYINSKGRYRYRLDELQLIGLKKLNHKYGHIFIRPETFEDKIQEIFTRQELDFKQFPVFSSKYYFLTSDELNGRFFATDARLNLIERQYEIQIEVSEDLLIAKFSKRFNAEDFQNMISFLQGI